MAEKNELDASLPADVFRVPTTIGLGDHITLSEEAAGIKSMAAKSTRRGSYELSSRLADYCTNIVNRIWEQAGYNLAELFDRSERELDDFFEKEELVESEYNSPERNRIIRKIRLHHILERMKSHVDIDEHLTVFIPLEKFVEEVGSKRHRNILIERKGRGVVEVLREFIRLSHGAVFNYRKDIPNENNTGLQTIFWSTSLIPEIGLKLTAEADERFQTHEEFLSSRVRNKLDMIEGVVLRFNREAILDQMIVYSEKHKTAYAKLDYQKRKRMSGPNARRMDTFLRSLYVSTIFGNRFHFTTSELMKKFDRKYSEYHDFKKDVVMPGVEEFNRFSTDTLVEYHEIKKKGSKKVEKVWFRFIPKQTGDEKFNNVYFASYYIATRIKYFPSQVFDFTFDQDKERAKRYQMSNVMNVAETLDELFKKARRGGSEMVVISSSSEKNRSVAEWREIASDMYDAWMRLSNFLKSHKEIVEKFSIQLDLEKMTLTRKSGELIFPLGDHPVSNPKESVAYLASMLDEDLAKELW